MPSKKAAVEKPAESKQTHMLLQESSYILKTYTRGVMRIKLENMACSPLSRGGAGVSGRHAHDVHRPIAERDGLVVWRYNRGICLAPNPKSPMDNSEFTNKYVETQRDLLCPVAKTALPGSISKTHLWHGLLTAKVGGYKYYKDGSPMVPNYSCTETKLTLEEGLLYETLEYEAYEKHPKAVVYLMQGENMDAAFAMAETEQALISSYFYSSRIMVATIGKDLFHTVDEAHLDGAPWPGEFKIAAFNWCNMVGPDQMKIFSECYQYFVNPKEFKIGAAQLNLSSKMPAAYPWCKLIHIIANLTTTVLIKDKIGYFVRGNAVTDAAVKSLQSVSCLGKQYWEDLEASVHKVHKGYNVTSLPRGDSHTFLRLGHVSAVCC